MQSALSNKETLQQQLIRTVESDTVRSWTYSSIQEGTWGPRGMWWSSWMPNSKLAWAGRRARSRAEKPWSMRNVLFTTSRLNAFMDLYTSKTPGNTYIDFIRWPTWHQRIVNARLVSVTLLQELPVLHDSKSLLFVPIFFIKNNNSRSKVEKPRNQLEKGIKELAN